MLPDSLKMLMVARIPKAGMQQMWGLKDKNIPFTLSIFRKYSGKKIFQAMHLTAFQVTSWYCSESEGMVFLSRSRTRKGLSMQQGLIILQQYVIVQMNQLPGVARDEYGELRDAMEYIYQLSTITKCSIDKNALSVMVALIEKGVKPEQVAAIVSEIIKSANSSV